MPEWLHLEDFVLWLFGVSSNNHRKDYYVTCFCAIPTCTSAGKVGVESEMKIMGVCGRNSRRWVVEQRRVVAFQHAIINFFTYGFPVCPYQLASTATVCCYLNVLSKLFLVTES
jgi:hypothetical protein